LTWFIWLDQSRAEQSRAEERSTGMVGLSKGSINIINITINYEYYEPRRGGGVTQFINIETTTTGVFKSTYWKMEIPVDDGCDDVCVEREFLLWGGVIL
jgi:hypothetical protein